MGCFGNSSSLNDPTQLTTLRSRRGALARMVSHGQHLASNSVRRPDRTNVCLENAKPGLENGTSVRLTGHETANRHCGRPSGLPDASPGSGSAVRRVSRSTFKSSTWVTPYMVLADYQAYVACQERGCTNFDFVTTRCPSGWRIPSSGAITRTGTRNQNKRWIRAVLLNWNRCVGFLV